MWCAMSCQKFAQERRFVPKRGHFNGNIAAGIFIWPNEISCEIVSPILLSPHVSIKNTKKHEFQIKQRCFISSFATVYCPWKYNRILDFFLFVFFIPAPNQIGNKCKWVFFLYYDFSPSVHRLTVSQYESMKMATAFVKPEGISASHLDSN